MTEASDSELLARFVRDASEPDFAALVERHLPLVHSVALRHTQNAQSAQDISQAVFITLARKAGTLNRQSILAGWLYETARLTAANWQRSEIRRIRREQEAFMQSTLTDQEPDAVWRELTPQLDAAMGRLNDSDRDALLLRYFQNRSLIEVSAALGINERAAQKRVLRALERLRKLIGRQGPLLSATAIAAAVSAHAVPAVPASLAAAISATALSGTAANSAVIIATTKTVIMTTLQKIAVTAALAVTIGGGLYAAKQAADARAEAETLRTQDTALAELFMQSQVERNNATNRLADLLAENARLRSNADHRELLQLRGEVAQLKAKQNQPVSDADAATAKQWTAKMARLKDYLQRNPTESIPEAQFMSERDWLSSIDPSSSYYSLSSDKDYHDAVDIVRDQAQMDFAGKLNEALMKYYQATQQVFPTSIAQLSPYLEPAVMSVLADQYEMVSASLLQSSAIQAGSSVTGDWMIARKTAARDQGQRIVIIPMTFGGSKNISYLPTYY
jgi:RNA polymerase sigma factor (sigma-70 family)